MNKMTLRTLPGLLLLAFAGLSSAAGFQIQEQSASGIATSFAGSAAVAENASTNYYNPAGLTQLPGLQISMGGVGLRSNVESSQFAGNAGTGLFVPNFYFAAPLTRDLYFGFGVSRPFGVTTKYDAGWLGAASTALKSEISTVNYNPSLAYRLNNKLSLGFGLNYQKLNAELTNAAGALQSSNDNAFGWNAGALFALSPAMRVGVAYRSAVDYRLQGNLNGDLKLPGTFTLSVWQQVSDNWEAMGDLSYTQWNRFDRSTLANTGADYRNAWRFAWGAAYKNNDSLKTKFGLAFDRSATHNGDVNLRVPEYNDLWLSVGAQWIAGAAGKVDLGYAYKISRDANYSTGATSGRLETSSHVLGLQYSAGF